MGAVAGSLTLGQALLIGGATAATSAGTAIYTSAAAAKGQESYARESYALQKEAIEVQQGQVREQEAVERYKMQNKAQQIRSRIRVRAGESGIGLGGTYEAMMRQVDYDAEMNKLILGRNARNQIMSIRSRQQPIRQQPMSPFLEGLTSGISGFASGLQIAQNLFPRERK